MASTANAQIPKLRINLPSGGVEEVCLDSTPGAISVLNGETFLEVEAQSDNLGCPGVIPVVNSFSISPSSLDITTLNCDMDGDSINDGVCLFVDWDITPAVTNTTACVLEQTQPAGKFAMDPREIMNPSGFVDPDNQGQFRSVINDLKWPVSSLLLNDPNFVAGDRQFRLLCDPGTVIAPLVTVNFNEGVSPAISLTPSSRNFGNVNVGSSANFNFSVTNSGDTGTTLTLSSITASGAGFSVTGGTCSVATSLAAGSSCTVAVRFAPTSEGNASGTLTVGSNAGNDTASLSGNGIVSSCPPPNPSTRDSSITQFANIYSPNTQWPGQNADNINIPVRTGQYMALAFTPGTTVTSGRLSYIEPPVGTSGLLMISIDSCPGVFPAADFDCNRGPALKQILDWTIGPVVPGNGRCELQAGQQYYLNLVFGERSNPSSTTCGSPTACTARINNAFTAPNP